MESPLLAGTLLPDRDRAGRERRRVCGPGGPVDEMEPPMRPARSPASRAIALGLAALGVLGAAGCGPAASQPIAFNHRLHADNGIPCQVCHPTAASGAGASLPTVALCQRCHEDVLYESAEEAKIRLAAASGRGIHWTVAGALKPHVYFSHRRHVTLGKLACAECHGEVELRTAPFGAGERGFAGRGGMAACIRCHEESHSLHAGTDCMNCHR